MRAVVYHDPDAVTEPAGLIGRYLTADGWDLTPVVRTPDLAVPMLDGAGGVDLSIHMGSDPMPSDPEAASLVDPERAAMRAALEAGVPVLGICFGAQLLAEVLGGTTGPAPVSEYGLYQVRPATEGEAGELARTLCPPGPWVQAHQHTFTVPDGALELGRSDAGPQGLVTTHGTRALGWQFHPEVLPATVRRWRGRSEEWAKRADVVLEAFMDEKRGLAEQSAALITAGITWLLGPR